MSRNNNKMAKKFVEYTPTSKPYGNCLYLTNADGDWYEQQQNFEPDTLKIAYDDDGIIRSFSDDASTLCPIGLYVAEIVKNDVPDDFGWDHEWVFINGEITPRIQTPAELQQQAESQKRYLMSQATNSITPLQYAVDLNMATDTEQSTLIAWKKYTVLLNRVDCSTAPNIDWPKAPE
ncbi:MULTISPECIES: tail fiber assembly protein [Xenorhabdus]|uniref:Tail assembly chaperone n=1 Tax=Xenorhabdus ehlersii TaxID=290111 RepID=A0A2D0IW02_9GAMM|nr:MULTISPECIES: tail fiber assembly protein [Xenorhabdus]MBC8949617.1 tail assembly chaperone [Xenorhabdus sp. TS4]PHM26089.1 tail assembly chaperone [Xenorhabdus ehlersii]RKE88659.1 virus tail fiber assembly protein lambda gpK [Xenorhabdus ehlersii]